MGVITETERQKYFAYLDGVADGLKESRNDVNEVLDKIRAEIASYGTNSGMLLALEILDKYRESEGAE